MEEGTTAAPAQALRGASILDSYSQQFPIDQNAVDIFKDEWSSLFPPPYSLLKAGPIGLFQDIRLDWAINKLGGVIGHQVLELGPLEGGHAYMLERAGAAYVTSIEANSRAYLKCLIAKEILQMNRTRFWYGNFIPYLEQTDRRFDLIIASGVLYHMTEPLKLLELISHRTDRLYMWTHYFDADLMANQYNFSSRFQGKESVILGDTAIDLYNHNYHNGLEEKTYCGGAEASSRWLNYDGLMVALRAYGFLNIEIAFHSPDHPNGPCLSLIATR